MSLEIEQSGLSGLFLLKPRRFTDERGFFCEEYNARVFAEATGLDVNFVQDNLSRSFQGVLRGLHYQLPPAAQGKLVRVLNGEVFDVAVDLRRESPTFGQWTGQVLSADNGLQLWIPSGFAHGFLVMSEVADVLYKTTHYYHPASERTIRWDDVTLNISWPLSGAPKLSPKDSNGQAFPDAETF